MPEARVRAAWERKRAALFDDGELPAVECGGPRIVSTGVDGIFIHSHDGPSR